MAQKFYNDELIISKGSNNFEFDLIHSYKDILSNSKVKRVHSNTLLSDATITPNLYEPLNTFTEVDSSGHINLSATTCTITSCPDDATCYAYKNYGASYFADFKHNFEINSANSFDHGPGLWGVSNNIGEYNGWSSGLAVTLAAGAGGFYHGLSLFDKSTGKISTLGGNWEFHINNTYYATVERRGATVTLKVYSDAARTSQLGPTATLTATDTTSYRYLYCFDTRGNYNYGTMSGFSQNFSIHLGIQQSIASDSIVKQENIQKTLYSNSKVILRSSQDIYSDSKVKYVFQKPLTSSSIIKIIDIQKEILSDTKVVSRNLENITSDSNILQIRQQNITSDASVTHTRTQDILSGSKIVTREQNGVLSDTIVKIVYQKDISSDSKIKQI